MREDYQQLIDAVSTLLGMPATLESRDFTLIAFAAHESDDDQVMDPVRTSSILRRGSTPAVRSWFESFGITRAGGPVRIPPEPSAGVRTGRICLPAWHRGVVYGYIWLLDDGRLTLDDPRLAEAWQLAERVGALLARAAQSGALLGELLHAVLVADPGERQTALRALRDGLGDAGGASGWAETWLAMVVITPWTDPATGEPASISATTPPGALASDVLAGPDGPTLALLVHLRSGADPGGSAAAERLLRSPLAAGGTTPIAGVSAAARGLASVPECWRQARAAAHAGRAEERLRPVARWTEIGPYRLLTSLAPSEGAGPDPAVAPLLSPANRELAHTAECYLDCAGQASRTASLLGIHRQTLYYRLARVSQLTGLDLQDGSDRLLLHMGLKTRRL